MRLQPRSRLDYCEVGLLLLYLGLWAFELWGHNHWMVAILICLPHTPSCLPLGLLSLVRLRTNPRRLHFMLLTWWVWLSATGCEWAWRWNPASQTFRVASYNLQGCPLGEEPVGQILQSLDADVYALQEVNAWTLKHQAFQAYASARWYRAEDGEFAILSRFPILSHELVRLGQRSARPAQVVEIQLAPGKKLRLINVHLSLLINGPEWLQANRQRLPVLVPESMAERNHQVEQVLQRVEEPTLLVGDCNGQPRDSSVRKLAARLTDSFQESGRGWGFTFESTMPVIRIDYLWHTPQLFSQSCWVAPGVASDHAAVAGDFVLR